MPITRADVQYVAHLARLGLDAAELDRMADQLSHILGAMDVLNRLDTSAIPPTAQVIPLTNVMRDDVPRPSWPVEDILRNAPRAQADQLLVPSVFEQ
jgi:aspartyl-tRNA(Asn)/glutamyl-tRNA(Gln) amidotransferase subunit C